jgi:type I restriction enzyme S subunit
MQIKIKFKQTEVGKIPEDWEVKELHAVCEENGIQTGPFGSQLHNRDYVKEGTPIVTVKHLGDNRLLHNDTPKVCESDRKRLIKYSIKEGDIIFSRVGSVDRRAIAKKAEEGWLFSGRCLRVRADRKKMDPLFLSYYFGLEIFKERVRGYAVGATMPSLNTKLLSEIKVVVPVIKEQYQIAKILSGLDSKIELNWQINKILEDIGQALFKRWFIDFEFPNEEGKPYKSSGGEMIDSDLGEIPKGWRVVKLGDNGTFKNGINYLRDDMGDTEFFITNVRDIANNKLLLKGSLDRIRIDIKKAKDYLLKDKDIIIARSASPGETSLVLGNLDNVIYSGFSIRYRLNNPDNYLYIFLIMQGLKENLSNFAVGTTLQSVNQETLKNMKFVLPVDETLKEFNRISQQIIDKTYNNLIQNSNLSEIRDSLLPKLMSGQIRVPVEAKVCIDER